MQHSVILYRISPEHNMRRFYRLDIQHDLFGNPCLIREWGRIGQVRSIPYSTGAEAQAALHMLRATKERRGYAA